MSQFKHALVIGASSGIGAELVRQLAAKGTKVAAVARRANRLNELAQQCGPLVLPFAHDVIGFDAIPTLFQEITKELGGLDLVIYAAGVMPQVGPDEFDFAKDRAMIEVNLLGAIAWLDQAAARFQAVGAGSIVGIGSVAGDRGRAAQPVYNTTKAALATYLEALRNRLSRHGVKVVTVKPGPTRTDMTAHLDQKGMMPPSVAAKKILALANRTGEHYLNPIHRVLFYVIKRIPSPIFRKMKL